MLENEALTFYDEIYNKLITFLKSTGYTLLGAIAALIIGIIVIKLLNKICKKIFCRGKMDRAVVNFLLSLIKFVLYIILIFTVASILKIPMTSFVALLSAAGLAVSLALQGSLGNMANGLVIIGTKPFRAGDFIQIGDEMGTVVEISLINTKIVTPDNKIIHIPNSSIISSNVINYNSQHTRRIDINVGISYGSDVEKAKEVITDVLSKMRDILKEPKPVCRLGLMNQSSLDIYVRAWCSADKYWDVYYDLTENIHTALVANNLEIPYPQMDVYVGKKTISSITPAEKKKLLNTLKGIEEPKPTTAKFAFKSSSENANQPDKKDFFKFFMKKNGSDSLDLSNADEATKSNNVLSQKGVKGEHKTLKISSIKTAKISASDVAKSIKTDEAKKLKSAIDNKDAIDEKNNDKIKSNKTPITTSTNSKDINSSSKKESETLTSKKSITKNRNDKKAKKTALKK